MLYEVITISTSSTAVPVGTNGLALAAPAERQFGKPDRHNADGDGKQRQPERQPVAVGLLQRGMDSELV